ncbi:MAG TPA: alpha-glucan family phosphorylase, partial [Prolixibacteraceae bacterium]|nr:alpha-glucan family phosphorylase [Prolixibacteraceae bacterium]
GNAGPTWKKIIVESNVPDELKPLKDLSRNLWWVWSDEARALFNEIDPILWEDCEHNPIVLLEQTSLERFDELKLDQSFILRMNAAELLLGNYLNDRKKLRGPKIAYFSMEFGLHSSLKIYSGGLGVLAGDFLKEASDSKVDMTGVGLLYRFGYFKQIISAQGEQIAQYDAEHFSKIPIQPVMDENGWVTVGIDMPGRTVYAHAWSVKIGNVTLYLLDTDYEANQDPDRFITHHLYGGDNENRLKQEMILGLGGIKLLEKIGIQAEIYHCNEGHAAFIGLERMKNLMETTGLSFPEAREMIRVSTLFTTHTPVPAGHDSFHVDLFKLYMGNMAPKLKLSLDDFLFLGKASAGDDRYNMSFLASNFSQQINGVSMLHGKISKELLSELYKGFLPEELENIGYVTNGVHYPTWAAPEWKSIHEKFLKPEKLAEDIHDYDEEEETRAWRNIYKVQDNVIWETKSKLRDSLINYVKQRFSDTHVQRNENPKYIAEAISKLDPKALTIGFARRFATYKRAHLLFRNLDRLAKIVNNPDRPVQFLFAGKAHPADKAGQDLIKFIFDISKRPEFVGRILFLQNYDMNLAKMLVQGCDVWMNTPTRPLEASGTSGEKGVMNGTLHFSVLDGWWVEGYKKDAGWALPLERTFDNQELQDELDAEAIYSIFENEIIPAYYYRNDKNVPSRWVDFIKNTFADVVPHFTTRRMMKDYFNRYYIPLSTRRERLRVDNFSKAKEIAAWKANILSVWDQIEVVNIQLADGITNTYKMGQNYPSQIVLDLKGLSASEIGVEVIIASGTEHPEYVERHEFQAGKVANGMTHYSLSLTLTKPGSYNYGVRIFPKNNELPNRQDFRILRWI